MVKHINSVEEFNSLLDYYISCLDKEDLLSLTFNYRSEGSKFHSNIFKKEGFFLQKKEQIVIKKTPEIEKIFKNHKVLQKNMPLFYGYPLFMDSNGTVSPLFFVEMYFEEKGDTIIFTKESVKPDFNYHVLTKHNHNVEEIEKIRSEIDEEKDFSIKLQKITDLLKIDKISLSTELEKTPLIFKSSPQFINKAILYFGERLGFTRGLVQELNELKKKPQHLLESTSLGFLFNNEKSNVLNLDKDFLEIFNLNESQEKAINNTFQKNVSVITGPPGTGKSQVVLNTIANAVWNDKTVLFASKNNRAVDVVHEKLKTILSKDLIIRTGSSKHRKNAKLQIHKLFQNKNSLKISSKLEEDIKKIKKINTEVYSLSEQLKEMSKSNREIEELQKQIDIRAKQIPEKLYGECKYDKFDLINKFKLESEIVNHFGSTSLLKTLIRIIVPSYYKKKEQELFKKYYGKLSDKFKAFLDRNIRFSSGEIKKALVWVLNCKVMDLDRECIDAKKQKLLKLDSIYDTLLKIDKLKEQRIKTSRKVFENYWLKKLKKTTPKDENHVSRYLDASEKLEKFVEDRSLWRQLVGEQRSEMKELLSFLPIWIVTNLSAKNSLPLKENLFDLLVIDEASQCDIASALPLFYRAKQVVIIGDPKQLKHISLLRDSEDKKIASENKISKLYLDYAHSKNSLYDIAERMIKDKNELPILLNQHYRSHKDIIGFSNKNYYEEKLNIMTDENKLIKKKVYPWGIEWIDIKGKTKNLSNNHEIIAIHKKLMELRKSNLKNISLGIVTLFRSQAELITNMINKEEEFEEMDITVGTAHRFQGDEKDIIIFSPVVSEGIKQRTLNWIKTTKQLLNVAITRARSTLIIVGDKKKCIESGEILKDLAEYVESKKELNFDFDSPVEEKLFKKLNKGIIKIFPQYETKIRGGKTYRLDFALFVNGNKYNIEVDGAKAHSQKVEADILRDTHLRMEGWKIRRFQANEVNEDLDVVVEEIKRFC